MTAPPSRATDGKNRAEIDDIGPIFKACAAFNAWYRHACGSCKNRAGLRFVKRQPDATRSRNKPILRAVQRDRQPFPRPQIEPRLTEATDAMSFLAFGSISSGYLPHPRPGLPVRQNIPGEPTWRLELHDISGFFMLVGARGFEPPTPCSRSRCATRLRYAPTVAGSYRVATLFARG